MDSVSVLLTTRWIHKIRGACDINAKYFGALKRYMFITITFPNSLCGSICYSARVRDSRVETENS